MKFAKIKQKVKDIGAEHGLKISATCGVICGLIGLTAAEYYRREYNKLLLVDDYFEEKGGTHEEDEWHLPPVSKQLMDEVRDGATLKFREKRSQNSNRGTLGQFTTLPEWPEEMNEEFRAY